MINIILSLLASILLLVGLVSMVTPIPGGTIMIAIAITILICVNPIARSCLRYFRARINYLNQAFLWLEAKLGTRIKFIGDALEKTHP